MRIQSADQRRSNDINIDIIAKGRKPERSDPDQPGRDERAHLPSLVVIDSRTLFRECFSRCLEQQWRHELAVISLPSVQAWKEISDKTSASLILLWASAHRSIDDVQQDLKNLCEMPNPVPAVVVSDTDNVDHVLASLENGARGYIPVNLSFDIAVEAMRFVKAGGTFIPANMLLMAQRSGRSLNQDKPEAEFFTSRQAAVIEALRMGKPNKSIAYELNMCESTVKVHVRNIMKKLKAKNRTEVAFMANKMLR